MNRVTDGVRGQIKPLRELCNGFSKTREVNNLESAIPLDILSVSQFLFEELTVFRFDLSVYQGSPQNLLSMFLRGYHVDRQKHKKFINNYL